MKKSLILLSACFAVTGCLKTVNDIRSEDGSGSAEEQKQTASQQRAEKTVVVKEAPKAAATARFEEYDEQIRNLNGRMDTLENHLTQNSAAAQGEKASVTEMAKYTDQKFSAYEEELKKLDAKIAALSAELEKVKSQPAPAASTVTAGKSSKTSYDEAEGLFDAKKWKEAIVSYQKYRDQNPKGKMYADSTYKIGVCFQELKMKDEAKAFFEEVTAKFPKSKEAKKAAFRLKQLK
jgi:TolA-binding protein